MNTSVNHENNHPADDSKSRMIGKIYQDVRMEIFSIFRQACISEETCEDLVQEVFMKVLSLDVILEEHLKALVVTIAYQKRTDYLRHRAYINKVKNEWLWRMEQSYTNTMCETKDLMNAEMKVIRCMSEKDACVYKLMRFEEKTADEIVMETGLSKRAVESRIYRTRNMVRDNLRKVINF